MRPRNCREVLKGWAIGLTVLVSAGVVLGGCASSPTNTARAFLTAIPTPSPVVARVPAPLLVETRTVAPTMSPTPIPPTPTAIWALTPTPPTGTVAPATPTTSATLAVFEEPASGARVTLPIHLIARVSAGSPNLTAELDYVDGTKVSAKLPVLPDPAGGQFLIGSVEGTARSEARPTQAATLLLKDADGRQVAALPLTVLAANDPGTVAVKLFFLQGTALRPEIRRIPRTPQIATVALEQLLWGPSASSGLSTSIPSPTEVLGYAGRGTDWGPRVRVLSVSLSNGVATANFSRELAAYGGGSDRIRSIQAQVTSTLEQFSTIKSVRLAIEGQTQGILQP